MDALNAESSENVNGKHQCQCELCHPNLYLGWEDTFVMDVPITPMQTEARGQKQHAVLRSTVPLAFAC